MISRLAAVIAAGVLVATGLATSATAAAPALADTVRVANNLDTGNNGYWAWLNFRRATTITKTAEGEGDTPDTYQVVLSDSGSLRTIRGANSPEAGVPITSTVDGSFAGRYVVSVTSDEEPRDQAAPYYNYRCRPDSTPVREGDCTIPASTGDWYKLYFAKATPVGDPSYAWTYRTCAERWTDNGARGQGDITGKRCDRVVRADDPTVVQPECGATRGKLVIPADRGVGYKASRDAGRYLTLKAGTYDVRPALYRVRAYALPGYRLVGDTRWTLTVEPAKPCPTPTPTPTVTVEPTPTPTPDPTDPDPTEEPEPEPVPTVTQTNTRVVVVNNIPVPSRVDTGLGGLARR
jgi:hypothetical protein